VLLTPNAWDWLLFGQEWGHRPYPSPGSSVTRPLSPDRNARQDRARPERKRFRVSLTPSGETVRVYGSPSISTSRRMAFVSFVVISR
jgi:hypothetical protein